MDLKTELEEAKNQAGQIAANLQNAQSSVSALQTRLVELQGVVRFLQDKLNPKEITKGPPKDIK